MDTHPSVDALPPRKRTKTVFPHFESGEGLSQLKAADRVGRANPSPEDSDDEYKLPADAADISVADMVDEEDEMDSDDQPVPHTKRNNKRPTESSKEKATNAKQYGPKTKKQARDQVSKRKRAGEVEKAAGAGWVEGAAGEGKVRAPNALTNGKKRVYTDKQKKKHKATRIKTAEKNGHVFGAGPGPKCPNGCSVNHPRGTVCIEDGHDCFTRFKAKARARVIALHGIVGDTMASIYNIDLELWYNKDLAEIKIDAFLDAPVTRSSPVFAVTNGLTRREYLRDPNRKHSHYGGLASNDCVSPGTVNPHVMCARSEAIAFFFRMNGIVAMEGGGRLTFTSPEFQVNHSPSRTRGHRTNTYHIYI